MKTIVALFLASCLFSQAQSNAPKPDVVSGKIAPYEATAQLMHAVIYGGTVEAVKQLLDEGADVNAKNDDNYRVLQLAARRGDLEIVKLLLDRGANVNGKDDGGGTALMSAARRGYTDIAKQLIQKGAEVNAKYRTQATALSVAAEEGFTNMVLLLLDNQADINATNWAGDSVLTMAVVADKVEVVKILLARGAKVNIEDTLGRNSLDIAKEKGNTAIVQLLQRSGAVKSSSTKQNEEFQDSLNELKKSANALSGTMQKFDPAETVQSPGSTASAPVFVNQAVASGTNTDSAGNVTNADLLMPFTLTNSFGKVITNAVLVKLMPNKFTYFCDSGGGMLPLSALPEELRDKCGYDPESARAADLAEQQQKEQKAQAAALRKQQQAWQDQPVAAPRAVAYSSIADSIKAYAQKKWPGEYDMQQYEINKQTEAYNWLSVNLSAAGVPQETFNQIRQMAVEKWPGEYDMQQYEIKKQVEAYRTIQR